MSKCDSIKAFEQWLGSPVASALAAFVEMHGGSLVGERCTIYAPAELRERNECYETRQYCPGWITVGDDGGGRAVMVSPSLEPSGVFVVDHGAMTEECFLQVADGLSEWAKQGFRTEPGPENMRAEPGSRAG